MNLVALPSQSAQEPAATCSSCAAALVPDQHYCLSCGQPCSPVRLPFLGILQQADGEARTQTAMLSAPASRAPVGYAPVGYAPALEPDGALGWLHRYSGLLALVGVLLLTGLIGLLIGHWTKSGAGSGPQVVRVEFPNGSPLSAAAAPAASTIPATTSTGAASSAKSAPLGEAQEKKEAREAEASTVKAPPPVKTGSATLKKLSKTTGKAHQKEIESLTAGGKPIETSG